MVEIGEVGVNPPDTSISPTKGELGAEDEARKRLTYGFGDGFGDSVCGDSGVGISSSSSCGVYGSSRTALGGGRSTIASRS